MYALSAQFSGIKYTPIVVQLPPVMVFLISYLMSF